eukprot:1853525-Rhodomonas_salina.2
MQPSSGRRRLERALHQVVQLAGLFGELCQSDDRRSRQKPPPPGAAAATQTFLLGKLAQTRQAAHREFDGRL